MKELREFFLADVPSTHITYALTIVCKREVALNKSEVKNVIESVYKRINENFVHHRNYSSEKHRHLMPMMLAVLETDDKVLTHCHALIAVHPELAEKFDSLTTQDSFRVFDERISNSCLLRTIDDDADVITYETPTNVEKWMNYMTKQKNVQRKSSDDFLMFAPKKS